MDNVLQLLAPGECTVDAQSGVVLVKAPASPAVREVKLVVDRVVSLCRDLPRPAVLLDLRGWDAALLTPDHVGGYRALHSEFAQRPGVGRTALLVDTDLAFGLGRMYGVMGTDEEREVQVFRDGGQALAWLSGAAGESASAG